MTKSNGDVLKFDFQEIDFNQIAGLVPQLHKSKYEALRIQIINKINSLPENKSFMFAPANGHRMTDKLRHGVLSGVNNSLREAHLNWRLLFSGVAKAFVVAPYQRKYGSRTKQVAPSVQPTTESTGFTQTIDQRYARLLQLVHKCFKVSEAQLQEKQTSREITDVRAAALFVGKNGLGLRVAELSRRFHCKDQSAMYLISMAQKRLSAEQNVKQLIEELNRS